MGIVTMEGHLNVQEPGWTAVCDKGNGSKAASRNQTAVGSASAAVPEPAEDKRFNCSGDVDRIIGKRVRERRIMLGLNLKQLAHMVGVTYQQAHKYERGANRISASRLVKIASALNVEVAWFFETLDRADKPAPPDEERMLLGLARSFAALPSRRHKTTLCELARIMAQDCGDEQTALSA